MKSGRKSEDTASKWHGIETSRHRNEFFFKDVVTVKVMAAVGAGAVTAVRPILTLGVFGGDDLV